MSWGFLRQIGFLFHHQKPTNESVNSVVSSVGIVMGSYLPSPLNSSRLSLDRKCLFRKGFKGFLLWISVKDGEKGVDEERERREWERKQVIPPSLHHLRRHAPFIRPFISLYVSPHVRPAHEFLDRKSRVLEQLRKRLSPSQHSRKWKGRDFHCFQEQNLGSLCQGLGP